MLTNGLADTRPPILVLGVGNTLLADDGVGLALLKLVSQPWGDRSGLVEFLDGGTAGLQLLGDIGGRPCVLLLDAVRMGVAPGTVHVLRGKELLGSGAARASTAHESNAGELLSIAAMLGESPREIALVGIEPELVETGLELSASVERSLSAAAQAAQRLIEEMAETLNLEERRDVSCCTR